MGGRGASMNRSYYRDRHGKFVKYGEEYTTLLQHGRIKFVTVANPHDSVTSPRETRTQGRIYVTVGKGKPKCITFYQNDGRKRVQIDLDHLHHGECPHKHIGYNHGKDGKLTASDKKLIEQIKKIWKEHNEHEQS